MNWYKHFNNGFIGNAGVLPFSNFGKFVGGHLVEIVDYDGTVKDYGESISGLTNPCLYQITAFVEWLDGGKKRNLNMVTRTNEF
jgi:hypothetical protein